MNLERDFALFDRTLQLWLQAIDAYDDNDWWRSPAERVWSVGQVYAHLVDVSSGIVFDKLAKCDEREERGRKSFAGRIVYLIGSIPPIRVKAPMKGYAPQALGRDEARAQLLSMRDRMRDMMPLVERARGAATHPFLGKLNAHEWFVFSEMHLRHHLRQKKRIDHLLAH